jgi:leader peptidase (prepilin peptidase)/N-methyltransferase
MTSLTPLLVVFAGLLGLAIGSFLNVVAYRVPAGIPLTRERKESSM